MEEGQQEQQQEQPKPAEETAPAQDPPNAEPLSQSPEQPKGEDLGATLGSNRLPIDPNQASAQNLNQAPTEVPQVDEHGNPIMQEEKKEVIPPEVLEDMQNIYSVFDLDNKNQVSILELRTILRALDIDPDADELEFLTKLIDPEQNGFFSYE